MQVWPDVHTAPGSQNGFDNSGHLLVGEDPTCRHWDSHPENVKRSVRIVEQITERIKEEGLTDVVTGFGPLNEPFVDCNETVVRGFYEETLEIVRRNLGEDAHVYVGDLFNASKWNNGFWGNEPNTFLDSHYYHVFAEAPRALSPRQHIAYVCRKNERDTTACCYADPPQNTVPSKGISRIIGEWSAAPDTLVCDKLDVVMDGIAKTGKAAEFDRRISPHRREFLRHFVEAQMVAYEAVDKGISSGWFYWTLKMEGGAFAEWDYLRGIKEGWIPKILPVSQSSESVYGSCTDIMLKTKDRDDILTEFPPQMDEGVNWQGVQIDDDLVVSHGESIAGGRWDDSGDGGRWKVGMCVGVLVVVFIGYIYKRIHKRQGYQKIVEMNV